MDNDPCKFNKSRGKKMKEILIAGHRIRVNSTSEEANEDYVPRLPEDGLSFNDFKDKFDNVFFVDAMKFAYEQGLLRGKFMAEREIKNLKGERKVFRHERN